MGKRTGDKKPERNPLIYLCATGRYLSLDISLLFDCQEGIDSVATYVSNGEILCMFHWKWEEYGWGENHRYDFDRIVNIPCTEEYKHYWEIGRRESLEYKRWVMS